MWKNTDLGVEGLSARQQCFFSRGYNVPIRENFLFYSVKTCHYPWKNSESACENNLLPWKMKENYTREN